MKFVSPIGEYVPLWPYPSACNPWLALLLKIHENPINSPKPQRGYARTSDLFCSGHPIFPGNGDVSSQNESFLKTSYQKTSFFPNASLLSCEDQLLTQTFEEPLGQILELLPKERQTLFFSATITQCIQKLKKGKDLTFIVSGAVNLS